MKHVPFTRHDRKYAVDAAYRAKVQAEAPRFCLNMHSGLCCVSWPASWGPAYLPGLSPAAPRGRGAATSPLRNVCHLIVFPHAPGGLRAYWVGAENLSTFPGSPHYVAVPERLHDCPEWQKWIADMLTGRDPWVRLNPHQGRPGRPATGDLGSFDPW